MQEVKHIRNKCLKQCVTKELVQMLNGNLFYINLIKITTAILSSVPPFRITKLQL